MKDQQINKRNKKQKAHKNKFTNRQENMSKKLKMKATEPGVVSRGKDMLKVEARNEGQRMILNSLNKNIITIVDAPAGVGKSHLAVLYGINQLFKGNYQKFIIARNIQESYGQNLGFLPGDINSKTSVYFQHLMDILSKHFQPKMIQMAVQHKQIQMVPFAYLRGRNFENSFVFCDQVQNTIPEQFRLIVSRLCEGSKMVLCGDSRQSDRKDRLGNGLADAVRKFNNVEGIGVVKLGNEYIVRSKIVQTIQQIYQADPTHRKDNNQVLDIKKSQIQQKNNCRDTMGDGSIPSRDSLWT